MGEGQALPPTPGLPLRGGFPTDTSPWQMAMGEGEQLIWGRAKPSPGPPIAGAQPLSNGYLPLSALARGEGLGGEGGPGRPDHEVRCCFPMDAHP